MAKVFPLRQVFFPLSKVAFTHFCSIIIIIMRILCFVLLAQVAIWAGADAFLQNMFPLLSGQEASEALLRIGVVYLGAIMYAMSGLHIGYQRQTIYSKPEFEEVVEILDVPEDVFQRMKLKRQRHRQQLSGYKGDSEYPMIPSYPGGYSQRKMGEPNDQRSLTKRTEVSVVSLLRPLPNVTDDIPIFARMHEKKKQGRANKQTHVGNSSNICSLLH